MRCVLCGEEGPAGSGVRVPHSSLRMISSVGDVLARILCGGEPWFGTRARVQARRLAYCSVHFYLGRRTARTRRSRSAPQAEQILNDGDMLTSAASRSLARLAVLCGGEPLGARCAHAGTPAEAHFLGVARGPRGASEARRRRMRRAKLPYLGPLSLYREAGATEKRRANGGRGVARCSLLAAGWTQGPRKRRQRADVRDGDAVRGEHEASTDGAVASLSTNQSGHKLRGCQQRATLALARCSGGRPACLATGLARRARMLARGAKKNAVLACAVHRNVRSGGSLD